MEDSAAGLCPTILWWALIFTMYIFSDSIQFSCYVDSSLITAQQSMLLCLSTTFSEEHFIAQFRDLLYDKILKNI